MRHFCFIILACFGSAALAQPAGERLVPPALPGFVVGHRLESGGSMIVEQVPRGETVQSWTRMVTVQRFAGVGARLAPAELLGNMARGLASSCPGGKAGPIQALTVSGRPAAEFRADCPRNPATGKPETFIARSIAGAEDMHVVQVAFRSVPSDRDSAWARAHLQATRLCGPGASCR